MKKGFTLIELLVVIGVIVLLIAILMPALAHARQQAQTIKCVSNLRQLAVAAFNYAARQQGSLPLARDATSEWDFQVVGGVVSPGILWLGQTSLAVQQCPNYDGKSPTATDPYTGYNYNTSYIGHGVGEVRKAPAKLAQIHRATYIALFGDGQYYSGTDKYMRAPAIDTPLNGGDNVGVTTRAAGTQGYRHLKRTNVVFCDGHAESLLDRFTTTSPTATFIGAGTGFLSVDNSRYNPY